jgi:hypothetical protein
MKRRAIWLLLLVAWVGGCAGRQIFHASGCDERLALAYKRAECHACVQRPVPHEYLPDNPDGARCTLVRQGG